MKSPSYPTLVRAASSSSPRRVSRRSSSRPTNSTRHWPCLARIGGHLPFDEPIRHPRRSSLPTVRAIIRPLYVQSSRPSHVRQVPMPRGGRGRMEEDCRPLPYIATIIAAMSSIQHLISLPCAKSKGSGIGGEGVAIQAIDRCVGSSVDPYDRWR